MSMSMSDSRNLWMAKRLQCPERLESLFNGLFRMTCLYGRKKEKNEEKGGVEQFKFARCLYILLSECEMLLSMATATAARASPR